MLDAVKQGLDRVDKQPVGRTTVDVQAYLRSVAGVSQGGISADISKRFTESLSGFVSGQLGVQHSRSGTTLDVYALAGIRGYF